MSKRTLKFFLFFSFVLSQLHKRWIKISALRKGILAYPILVWYSGVLQSPWLAVVVAGIYELGFIGLILFYTCRNQTGIMRWAYLVLGTVLMVLSVIWLELLYLFMPYE